jgi:hypothetical protein
VAVFIEKKRDGARFRLPEIQLPGVAQERNDRGIGVWGGDSGVSMPLQEDSRYFIPKTAVRDTEWIPKVLIK